MLDPTECLRQLLEACNRFTEEESEAFNGGTPSIARALGAATIMRDQVIALNTWLNNGGYLPEQWNYPDVVQKS